MMTKMNLCVALLNEIDAKQYLLKNAQKYKMPRNEIELTEKQLLSYQQQLKEIMEGKNEYCDS